MKTWMFRLLPAMALLVVSSVRGWAGTDMTGPTYYNSKQAPAYYESAPAYYPPPAPYYAGPPPPYYYYPPPPGPYPYYGYGPGYYGYGPRFFFGFHGHFR